MVKHKRLSAGLVETKKPPEAEPASAPEPPAVVKPTSTASEQTENLNFKVTPAFAKQFRVTAAQHGLKLNKLLIQAFEVWLREARH
jgi:hypothetical protein